MHSSRMRIDHCSGRRRGLCPTDYCNGHQGGLCRGGVSVQGVSVRRSLSRRGSQSKKGGLCPEWVSLSERGSLSRRGLCPEGGLCLGGVSVQGVSLQSGEPPSPMDRQMLVKTLPSLAVSKYSVPHC